MPCKSDYMEPTDFEARMQETAQLCIFVAEELGIDVPGKFWRESNVSQARDVGQVQWLCGIIREMDEFDVDRIIYDGRRKKSRELANWWEEHEEADAKRIAQEMAEKNKEKLIASAKTKLSPAEWEAVKNM